MIKIEKKYHFYAGHRNKEAGIKCGRLHGHTYNVKCIFGFKNINNGITILFSDIDKQVEPIIKFYDHQFLVYEKDPLAKVFKEMGEPFRELPFETSVENMAIMLFNKIRKETKLPIVKIKIAETKSSTVIYEG